jgi:digeranylgeranylglycerophospholipid reductase
LESYDIIVAGAGMAGSLAAAAAAKNGAKVLLLDRNDHTVVGRKTNWGWVCGDAVAKTHIDFIEKELQIKLGEPVLDLKVDGVQVLSPDMQHKFPFEGEGYSLDRPKAAKYFAEIAIKNGAEYRPHYEVGGPLLENNQVVGIYGRNEKNEQVEIKAKLTIDTLGIASNLRRKLPPNEYIENMVSTDDIESTGRYIGYIEHNGGDLNYYDPKNALIHLNQVLAPGGYGWVFPKTNGRINVGVGVEKKSIEVRNKKLGKTDTLHTLIDGYVKWNPEIKEFKLDPTDENGKGYWSVTVKRQFDSLVYPGYMGAGDSMAMPNPISAGGIGPAMVAGVLAGEVAGEAIAAKDTSMNFIWKYNVRYNDLYGNKTAALEAFRVYLQSLNNDLINYGMAHFLTEQEAVDISYGRIPEITITGTFQKVLSGISNINAFKNLVYTVGKMKKMNKIYSKYPSMHEFAAWKKIVNDEMREVKERFPPNPV